MRDTAPVAGPLASTPQVTCPDCRQATLAVSAIELDRVTTVCHSCGHTPTAGVRLPFLRKRIIYLDQFALSRIRKSRDLVAAGQLLNDDDQSWLDFGETLRRSCERQLSISPVSEVHEVECANATSNGRAIRDVAAEFSHGLAFKSPSDLVMGQICTFARSWPVKEEPDWIAITGDGFTEGGAPHTWWKQKHWHSQPLYGDSLLRLHNELDDNSTRSLGQVWERWKSGRGDFAAFVKEESEGMIRRLRKFHHAEATVTCVYEDSGLDRASARHRAVDFLTHADLSRLPYVQVNSILSAQLRHRAASSSKDPCPSRNLFRDLQFLGLLLPYCDDMLVDGHCFSLVSSNPACSELGDDLVRRVHAQWDRTRVADSLRQGERAASDEHRKWVQWLYDVPLGDWG